MSLSLADCREQFRRPGRGLEDRDGLYGGYRSFKGRRPDLYASLDIALIRTIMPART